MEQVGGTGFERDWVPTIQVLSDSLMDSCQQSNKLASIERRHTLRISTHTELAHRSNPAPNPI
uniref:Uncharacterized protein n=1 Tax=Picea sitchensis TaxID=3332 RepID=A0A6B9XV30_PICSI|nr:hypothetical protein Q903MT_gene6829 [Picea sitchensis]